MGNWQQTPWIEPKSLQVLQAEISGREWQGLITIGLNNHIVHIVALKIEYYNQFDDALENAKLKRDTVTKDMLKKLAVAFKNLWNGLR